MLVLYQGISQTRTIRAVCEMLERQRSVCMHFEEKQVINFSIYSLVRNPDPKSDEPVTYLGDLPAFADKDYVACPVKRGSLVVLDGLVVHKSEPNHSTKSRLAYTFHLVESDKVKWSGENWIQLPENEQFARLY